MIVQLHLAGEPRATLRAVRQLVKRLGRTFGVRVLELRELDQAAPESAATSPTTGRKGRP